MPCSPPSRRHRAEPPDDAAGLTRRDFMVGLVAASLAVARRLAFWPSSEQSWPEPDYVYWTY